LKLTIRLLEAKDITQIAEAFQHLGWNKPASQYEAYLKEQSLNIRDIYVAFADVAFAGYITIHWETEYPSFREAQIPEIKDLNVLPQFRRHGIATKLMDKAEQEIAKKFAVAGIGVGMGADYGAAQRLYVLRGYIPDGKGICYKNHFPQYGEAVPVGDDLVLYFTKNLKG
jgi:GNAT superfamily N-acetyltransferase